MINFIKVVICLVFFLSLQGISFAWDGYENITGDYIELNRKDVLKKGQVIDYYDHDKAEYRFGVLDTVEMKKNTVRIQILDFEESSLRNFDLEYNKQDIEYLERKRKSPFDYYIDYGYEK